MKVIRSNPWGFGIHSPFVYHLVTQVIFGNRIPFPENKTGISELQGCQKRKLNLILRLARHFHPEAIILEEEKDGFTRILRTLLPPEVTNSFAELPCQKTGKGLELVVAATSRFFPAAIPGNPDPAVWILTYLENFEMRSLFNKLRNYEKVSLTIEVNKIGIVIFNHNFRKQNYVIRRFYGF